MLTCDDLRERIPAIEAGEHATGDERDHLAACEACRTEATTIREDLERVRRDLASLAPSPFLEDRVLEIASTTELDDATPNETAAARHPMRFAMVAGLAAALLVAAVLIVAHLPNDDEPTPTVTLPTEEGDAADEGTSQASGLLMPPTPLAVEEQRSGNARAAKPKIRLLSIGAKPRDGHAVLGREILERIAMPAGAPPRDRGRFRAAWGLLTREGRNPIIDIEVIHPKTKARGLVRAYVDAKYTGSLLLEEPFARALGLHTLELPGHATIDGAAKLGAQRTEAIVSLGDERFRERIEVQMRRAGDPTPLASLLPGGLPQKPRLELIGERPDMGFIGTDIDVHHMHDRIFLSADRNVPWRDQAAMPLAIPMEPGQPMQAAVEYREGDHPLCYVYLPPVDIGRGGPLAWRVRLDRVALEGRFEPGAEIAVARVWQGHKAVPTRDSAAFTTADANGRVSFVHVRGEAGPLRLRERMKDGSVRWHKVLIPDAGEVQADELRIAIDGHGTIHIGGHTFNLERDMHADDRSNRWTEGGARDALVARLKAAADAGDRDKDLVSTLRVNVIPQDNTPWTTVTKLLMACAHPSVRIDKIRFSRTNGGRTVEYEMPRDAGLVPARAPDAAKPLIMNLLVRLKGERTFYVVRDEVNDLLSDDIRGPGRKALASALRTFRKVGVDSGRPFHVDLTAYSNVPYEDVQSIMGLLRAAKLEDIRLMSSPPIVGDGRGR